LADGMRAPTSPIGKPDQIQVSGGFFLPEFADTVPDLVWPESIRTYSRMRRDPKISAVLKAMFLPIIRATWAVDPEGVDNDEAVQLVASDLGIPVMGDKDNPEHSPILGFSWADHVRMALLANVFGFMPFEQWYELRAGRTHLAGLQERLPLTISDLDISDDGQIQQVYQNTQGKPIPANRLVWYVCDREGSNWAGGSILRPCYTPWILKHESMRVHATSIRRFGMGIPTVTAPPGATPAQIAEAQRLASGMRAGDTAGAGLPDGYTFQLTGLTGAAPDAIGFLEYLDQQITGSALASIIELGHSTYGSKALGESFLDLFLLSLQAAADLVGDTATFGSPTMPGIARSLIEYNFGEGEPVPRIVCTDVGDRHEITSDALQLLISSGALTPDPVLEAFIRNAWGLPERVEEPPPAPLLPSGQPGQPEAPSPPQPAPPIPGQPQPDAPPVAARRAGGRRHRTFHAQQTRPRRAMTPVEAAAGLDPDGLAADLDQATDRLAGLWNGVLRDQRADLAAQVAAAVDDGDLSRLGTLTAPPAGGPALLTASMVDMAWTAASRAAAEAAAQRVFIDTARITVDEDRLGQVAAARSALAAQQLERAASHRALILAAGPRRAVRATPGDDAAQDVTIALEGLSPTPLAEQLAAALAAAQNDGRAAAFQTAEDDGISPIYVATEILDANCCDPCLGIDGTEFASLDAATAAYPSGAFVDCEGQMRCRGTYIASWPDVTITDPGSIPPDETPPEQTPADILGQLATAVDIDPAVTDAQAAGVAAALGGLPQTVRDKLAANVARLVVVPGSWAAPSAETAGELISVQGTYGPAAKELRLAADAGDPAAIHEALHAFDLRPGTSRMGLFSSKLAFRSIAADIRGDPAAASLTGPHYIPVLPSANPEGWEAIGNAEMFAELGQDYLTGTPYNLSGYTVSAPMPQWITDELDAYFANTFGG
jgi:hypothetical protein